MMVDVGVDGGQSQIRVAISGREGESTVEGVAHSDGDSIQLVATRVAEAWNALKGQADELGTMVLGLTTLPSSREEILRLASAIGQSTGARQVRLTGDAVIAHAGALPAGHGVVMVVGTGIACLGVDRESRSTRFVDGDGYLLGDNGASFWIGRHGIAAALASVDGRGPQTSLLAAAEESFGPIEGLAARVHAADRPVNAVAQFAAVVQEQARGGDRLAADIVAAAASQIVASVRAAAEIIPVSPAPVAITGRAAAPGTVLRDAVERLLAQDAALSVVDPDGTPLDGACRLAVTGDTTAYDTLITPWRAL